MTDSYTVHIANIPVQAYDFIASTFKSPVTIVVLGLAIILLAVNSFSGGNSSVSMLEVIVWSVFAMLVILNGLNYYFGIELSTAIDDIFSDRPKLNIDVTDQGLFNQVFHVAENKYVYPDAQAICQAYGARLATYSEVEDAYNNGAEWCSYGWSDGQMALFPTQKATWEDNQNNPGHENDCGRPGVNGGYIANPAVRFGVNCYGKKPRMTSEDKTRIDNNDTAPKTRRDNAIDQRADYWSDHLDDLIVDPYNKNQWNS
mgnify:CR=1 FL=1|jgi:hypothetical protein|tara:strand:+ start:1430 stop:2203 length:774 start_codon:yes stop_codon:yes gene_type:complete